MKNYQEDIVLNVLDIVLNERDDIEADDSFKYDVAAFALNRLPPKYLMGERGFARFAAEHMTDDLDRQGLFDMARVLMVVNTGVDVVLNRRRSNGGYKQESDAEVQELYRTPEAMEAPANTSAYWHNLPQVFGRVIATDTGAPLPEATVTFYIDDKKAEPAEPGWDNPSRTLDATKGFYCFWPMPVRKPEERLETTLAIAIEHDGFKPARIEKTVVTDGSYEIRRILDDESVLQMGTTGLEPDST